MYTTLGVNAVSLPWDVNNEHAYNASCASCEIRVAINSAAVHERLRRRLAYDKRKDGTRGRALTEAFADLGLHVGDRLEPTTAMPDVAAFDLIRVFPAVVLFWRLANETISTRRNPLFDSVLGITRSIIALDLLHTLYLGPMLAWCKVAMWLLLTVVWGSRATTLDEHSQTAVLEMRNELLNWYSEQSEHLTQVTDFTAKMIGTKTSQKLKLKAAETWVFLLFLLAMLRRYEPRLGDAAGPILTSGSHLEAYVRHIRDCRVQLTPAEIQANGGEAMHTC
jgi:hypothetical protein